MDKYFSLRGKSLLPAEYLSLLSVQGQFTGSVGSFLAFDDLVFYFWLQYSEIFLLLSLYITGVLLTSKWPSRRSRPLGLLFLFFSFFVFSFSLHFSLFLRYWWCKLWGTYCVNHTYLPCRPTFEVWLSRSCATVVYITWNSRHKSVAAACPGLFDIMSGCLAVLCIPPQRDRLKDSFNISSDPALPVLRTHCWQTRAFACYIHSLSKYMTTVAN